MTKDSKAKIRKILNAIRPALALHAGDVELVDFEKKSGAVTLRLKGGCMACPFSPMTGKEIERILKKELPEVKKVKIIN